MAKEGSQKGYTCAILNHFAPKDKTTGLRLNDLSYSEIVAGGIDTLKSHYPHCKEVYGVGFSLGGNYLLRSIGAKDEITGRVAKLNAVVTVG